VVNRAAPVHVRWLAPLESRAKINCDVALDPKNSRMGFDLLIRDWKGKVIAAAIHVVDFIADPVVGESMAALKAIEFCKFRGLNRIIVEGDSLQVVNSINKPCLNWCKYRHIVVNIHEVLRFFQT
jgi:ribonuclease HI